MKIKGFKCEVFGGIKGKEITFNDGLNVVLGPNEAGKSTVIEGIFNTLFKNHKPAKNSKEYREVITRFTPRPNGDSFDGSVSFEVEGQSFVLNKEWGVEPKVSFEEKGQVIKSEGAINAKIADLLLYGENTYGNIVFAKQKDLKGAIENISADGDTKEIIGGLLRKAVMALDGVSPDKLKRKLEEEYAEMSGRWDINHSRPEQNRGLANPWKSGAGGVVKAFYEKEQLRLNMEKAEQIERKFAEVVKVLKTVSEEKKVVREEVESLSPIEGDIITRAILEPEIRQIEKDIEELKEVNKQFPLKEDERKRKQEERKALELKLENLKEELEKAKKIKAAAEVTSLLEEIEKKEAIIKEKVIAKESFGSTEGGEIKIAESLQDTIATTKAKMEAATLIGDLVTQGKRLFITKGLEERVEVVESARFKAKGFFKLELEEGFELEVRAGEIDFDELKKQYTEAAGELQLLLDKHKVEAISDLKYRYHAGKELENELKLLQRQVLDLLKDREITELQKQVEETKELKARPQEEVEAERESLEREINKLDVAISVLKQTIEQWIKKYESSDQVLDLLVESKAKLREKENLLKDLAVLPAGFETPEAFNNRLRGLRNQLEAINEKEKEIKEEYYRVENQLPEISCEEQRILYQEAETLFQKRLTKLKQLKKIKEVFEKKLEEMDQGSFTPLVNSFSKYLAIVTDGSYEVAMIHDSLDIDIIRKDSTKLPINLLSAGTYDSVLLALRFALLEYLFQDRQGLVVLDDCLVNLDPARRQKAAELVREYAKENQVIFTTCDPAIADLLGGNRVAM